MHQEPTKPLEQIVRETGKHPLDAFIFVQECIGSASERVHGPMSPQEAEIASWMAHHHVGPDELQERFDAEELPSDILQAIREVGGPAQMNRHVTGEQLCWAIRDAALERWGLMARGVLARWGVNRTRDFGEIVFALVNNGWLQKQPTDKIEDFDDVFAFSKAFDKAYKMIE